MSGKRERTAAAARSDAAGIPNSGTEPGTWVDRPPAARASAYAAGVGSAGLEAGMAGDAEEEPELAAEAPPDWVPEGIDLATPSVARAYDYALGGSHSFAVDRALLRSVEAVFPQIRAS